MDLLSNTVMDLTEMDLHEEPSLIEIINRNKFTNTELIRAMDKIDDLVSSNNITKSDIEYLVKIDMRYDSFQLSKTLLMKHGNEFRKTILEATLYEAYNRALKFYDDTDEENRNEKLDNYKIIFIKSGIETEFILDYISRLEVNLGNLRSDYRNTIYNEFIIDLFEMFDIKKTIAEAYIECDLLKRKQIFVDMMADCDLFCLEIYLEPVEEKMHQEIIQKCKKAIEVIEYQILNTVPVLEKENSIEESSKNKDFTTKRQVLAMYYLLNHAGSKTGSVDRTVQARFIEFLTGKNYDSIYKTLSDPFKGLANTKNTSTLEDMEYIKNQFDKLELKEISKKIKGDTNI